jgi:hypothetical protein
MLAGIWWGILQERNNLEELDVDVRNISKWILKKYDERALN